MPIALYWLALGAFCIGTGSLMMAPLLPAVADEFGTAVAVAGQLVTLNALTYAISSPVLSTLLGNSDRKILLLAALGMYALAGLLAAFAQSFAQLMAAQFVLALAAGVFMPAANAVAAMLVAAEKRGRAIAIIVGGLTVSAAIGVPLASLIGSFASWRWAFVLVAVISLCSVVGVIRGLPSQLPRGTATLVERMAVARRAEVLLALSVTLFWGTGIFTFYTYIAPFLTHAVGIDAAYVPLMLFIFGVAGWIGNTIGGRLTDRGGPVRALAAGLSILAASYLAFSLLAHAGPSPVAFSVMMVALVVGSMAGWSFHPSQTARLVQLVPNNAVVALSLNASALYLGNAAGAALGGLTLSFASVADLGFTAAACELAGVAALFLAVRAASARMVRPQPGL